MLEKDNTGFPTQVPVSRQGTGTHSQNPPSLLHIPSGSKRAAVTPTTITLVAEPITKRKSNSNASLNHRLPAKKREKSKGVSPRKAGSAHVTLARHQLTWCEGHVNQAALARSFYHTVNSRHRRWTIEAPRTRSARATRSLLSCN